MQVLPAFVGCAQRLKRDLEQAKELVARLEKADREELFPEESNDESLAASATAAIEERCSELGFPLSEALSAFPEAGELQLADDELGKVRSILRKHLDLHLDLLREAYNCDYYTATMREFADELVRKAPGSYRRVHVEPVAEPTAKDASECTRIHFLLQPCADKRSPLPPGEDPWAQGFDSRIAMLTRPDEVDMVEAGGVDLEAELAEAAAPLVKMVDKEKHRCTVPVDGQPCGKLFKAPNFVQKHIGNKHKTYLDELAAPKLEQGRYLNNYVLDPNRPVSLSGPSAQQLPAMMMNMNPQMVAMMASMMGVQMPFDMGGAGGRAKRPRRSEGTSLGQRLGAKTGAPRGGAGKGRASLDAGGGGASAAPLPSGPLDPRASHGKKSYHDLDGIPDSSKDIELQY